MPKIPTVQSLGARPTPETAKPVIPIQLEGGGRGGVIEAQAFGQLGEGITSLGDSLAKLNDKDKHMLVKTQAEDRTSQYLDGLNRFTYDPNDGFMNRRGAAAVENDLHKEYNEKRTELAKKLDESLPSPEARNAFRQRVELANRQFDSSLYRHIAEQTNVYHEQTYDGVLTSERSHAAANWKQPGVIESSILRTYNAIDNEALRKGMPGNTVVAMKQIAEAQIHSTIVEQMLVEGKDQAALAYYQGIEKRLTPESRITLGLKVKASSIDGEAMRGAQAIWQQMGPKGENDPTMIADMENAARQQYKDEPRIVQSVISQLRSMSQANSAQQNEMVASRSATVLQKFNEGANLASIQRMPEYLAMDGTTQDKLRQHMLNTGWTEQQRARAETEFLEGEKGKKSFSKYWDLRDPAVLAGMSKNEIYALVPDMGQKLVDDLLRLKESLGKREGNLEATIDDNLFKRLAEDAGLKPYAKNAPEKDKAYLGNLRDRVETLIDVEQQQRQRKLTRQEKEEVMQKAIDTKVIEDRNLFFSEKRIPAGAVTEKQRSSIYVPIAEIKNVDGPWIKEALNHMRSIEAVSFRLTDEQILGTSKYRKRLENAYARRLSGASRTEIEGALRGE